MSAKSPQQYGMMQACAHNGAIGNCPSEAVAKEFIKKTPKEKRSKFASILAKKRKK